MALSAEGIAAPDLVICCAPITADSISRLLPSERKAIQSSAIKRQQEYATARILARAAMRSMGFPESEILNRPDRSPIWPDGLVGSLSHCDSYAMVVLGSCDKVLSAGCDIEPDLPLPCEVVEHILLPEEIDGLDRPSDSRLIFSAKEAFYKAQYSLTGTYLDFKDVTVCLYQQRKCFSVKLNKPAGTWKKGQLFCGRWSVSGSHILTLVHFERY
jgi:4'-phosphopantetheinyl transferase EntD